MKALKMNKWHSLAMAAALCCGAFSGLAHAADAMDAPAQNSAAAGRMAAPVQPVTLQEYLRIVVQNQPNLAADRMQADLARADSKTAATISNPAMHYSSKRGERNGVWSRPFPSSASAACASRTPGWARRPRRPMQTWRSPSP